MQSLSFLDYRHAVSRAVVALDVTAPEQERFRGAIDATAVGDIHVFAIDADGHGVHRTPSLINRAPQQYFKFSRIERGSGMIVQDGRETALVSGDMALYDTDRPYSLLFDDAVQMSVVMFPKVLLDIPSEDTSRITATRLNAEEPWGRWSARTWACSPKARTTSTAASPAGCCGPRSTCSARCSRRTSPRPRVR